MKPVELLCANSGLMHFSFTFQTRKLRLYFIHQWHHYKTDLSFNSDLAQMDDILQLIGVIGQTNKDSLDVVCCRNAEKHLISTCTIINSGHFHKEEHKNNCSSNRDDKTRERHF